MAVAEDGRYVGYLSGGCLEQAIVLEAQDVIAKRSNRLVRYGRGSQYVDIRLPCGSGLDVYFDQGLSLDRLSSLAQHRARRTPVLLRTELETGSSAVVRAETWGPLEGSRRVGNVFERLYQPKPRLLLIGAGPAMTGVAVLAAAIGLELKMLAADGATAAALAPLGYPAAMLDKNKLQEELRWLDFASAAVLLLHEHESEPGVLSEILCTRCFYIGALGNRAVHRARLAALAERGVKEIDVQRIRAPVGSIDGAKSKATLAVGVLAELMAEAKERNLVA
jgi:xanthine dehydrogenase accessory factor